MSARTVGRMRSSPRSLRLRGWPVICSFSCRLIGLGNLFGISLFCAIGGAPLSKSKFLGFIPGCLYDTTCDPCKDQPVWQFWVGSNTALFGVSGWVASIVSHPVLQRSPWRWRRRTEGDRASSHLQCQIGDGQDEKEKWYELRKKDISSKAQWGHDSYAWRKFGNFSMWFRW